jgi:pyruvate, water dikinase
MTAPLIRWTDEPGATAAELGGKVSSLAELVAAGFDVPPAFGVTTTAFRRFAGEAGLPERIAAIRAGLDTSDIGAVESASAQIAKLIEDAPMPADVDAAIREGYARLSEAAGGAAVPVAVRSSGVNEDLEGASFAGQYETYLWICGADSVVAHVRRCWSGLFNAAVLTYRPSEAADGTAALDELPGMCVGVQLMVRARTAGVMFTLDPVSGDRSKVVIESCWGLGEGVVKGDVTPDLHRVDKIAMEVLEREVSTQTDEYRFDQEAGAVALLPIPGERGGECSLSEAEVLELAKLGKRIERHRGAPQDLEWAIDTDGVLHLLQARPETVWAAKRAAAAAAKAAAEAEAGTATDRVMATFMKFGAGSRS